MLRYRLLDMKDYPTYICAVGIESNCRSRVASSMPAKPHTFVEIGQGIVSPSADSRRCINTDYPLSKKTCG